MKSLLDQKIIHEYPDAPSGSVFFYHYKEPLMRFDKGYGYQGALIYDTDSEKIQCHFCGEWFDSLGRHLRKEHNMLASEYKTEVGLNQTTALINESFRAKLIASGLDRRLKNLRQPKKRSEETKRKISETLKNINAEKQNKRNTCPEQLLTRLINLYNELGRTPKQGEITFYETLVKVWGSFENACNLVNIPHRKFGQTTGENYKWTRLKIVNRVYEFYTQHGRFPRYIDDKSLLAAIKKRFDYKEIKREVLTKGTNYIKPPSRFRFTREELLKFLKDFKEVNGRAPSYSDCKRGLLPSLGRYSYAFGSWKNALKESGV